MIGMDDSGDESDDEGWLDGCDEDLLEGVPFGCDDGCNWGRLDGYASRSNVG